MINCYALAKELELQQKFLRISLTELVGKNNNHVN
jgi:hypothetical protein